MNIELSKQTSNVLLKPSALILSLLVSFVPDAPEVFSLSVSLLDS
jgi:hypothetical protein